MSDDQAPQFSEESMVALLSEALATLSESRRESKILELSKAISESASEVVARLTVGLAELPPKHRLAFSDSVLKHKPSEVDIALVSWGAQSPTSNFSGVLVTSRVICGVDGDRDFGIPEKLKNISSEDRPEDWREIFLSEFAHTLERNPGQFPINGIALVRYLTTFQDRESIARALELAQPFTEEQVEAILSNGIRVGETIDWVASNSDAIQNLGDEVVGKAIEVASRFGNEAEESELIRAFSKIKTAEGADYVAAVTIGYEGINVSLEIDRASDLETHPEGIKAMETFVPLTQGLDPVTRREFAADFFSQAPNLQILKTRVRLQEALEAAVNDHLGEPAGATR